ncbi:MAG: hypothetical protein ABIL20_08555 [candidate division WOR-3 bacterium]
MVEVMNWGGGAQPSDIACHCGCICMCDCWCSCSNYDPESPLQFGEVTSEANLHSHNATTTNNANYEHVGVQRGTPP